MTHSNHVTIATADGSPLLTYFPKPGQIVTPITMPPEVCAALSVLLYDGAPWCIFIPLGCMETEQVGEAAFRQTVIFEFAMQKQLGPNRWTAIDTPRVKLHFESFRNWVSILQECRG